MRKAYVFKERQRYSIRKYSLELHHLMIKESDAGGHALAQEQSHAPARIA